MLQFRRYGKSKASNESCFGFEDDVMTFQVGKSSRRSIENDIMEKVARYKYLGNWVRSEN